VKTLRRGARLAGITELPPSTGGMRIALFGGSFNPPHAGHVLVAAQALRRLELDAVWLLVSPGNPLKDHSALAPLVERVTAALALITDPRIRVTGFEAEHGFRYSFDTLSHLRQRLADRRLVWLMGADNLVNFHRWERWQDIARLMPMAVYDRPGATRVARASRAAIALSRYRLDESDAPMLADCAPPAWVHLHGLLSPLSSSAIRRELRPGPASRS
jgi:nicotinate-nucleotide adenylyltransferase